MPDCFTCEQPIRGKTINAGGKSYHPDHFQCGWCKNPLVIEAYYTIDGANVCQSCRNKEKCAQCGHMITETKYVKVDDKVWHEECFVCDECFVELRKFTVIDDKMYCSECALEKRAAGDPDKCCAKCKQPLSGAILKALGMKWHENCFVCCRCSQPFPNDEFVKVDGLPYCDPCADVVEAEALKKLPTDLKNIHVSGGPGAGGASSGSGATAGGRSRPAPRAPAPEPVAASATVTDSGGDDEDEYSEKYKYLNKDGLPPKGESKYAMKKGGKLVSTANASRDRDYKSKAALMVGADASHLNELENNAFSSKR